MSTVYAGFRVGVSLMSTVYAGSRWASLRHTWHEALSCPVWIDCHVHLSGFRTDSDSYHKVVAKHT
jgi:hypothetical protein